MVTTCRCLCVVEAATEIFTCSQTHILLYGVLPVPVPACSHSYIHTLPSSSIHRRTTSIGDAIEDETLSVSVCQWCWCCIVQHPLAMSHVPSSNHTKLMRQYILISFYNKIIELLDENVLFSLVNYIRYVVILSLKLLRYDSFGGSERDSVKCTSHRWICIIISWIITLHMNAVLSLLFMDWISWDALQ